MLTRKFNNPTTLMRLGMLFLVLANLSKFLLHRSGLVSADAGDLIMGLFYGLAIGTLLLFLTTRRASRPRS
jgi:hypothetical protein